MTTSSSSTQADLQLERSQEEECLASFWHQATPGTTYYRCYLPAKHLPGQNLTLAPSDMDWDNERDALVMPRQRGAGVWQFLGDPWRSKLAWGQQEHMGLKVLMEVDDNYTVPVPPVPGRPANWAKTIEESVRPGRSGYSYEMHKKILPTFDGIIVSTPYLKKVYDDWNDNVFVCRNQVDPEDWPDFEPKDPEVLRLVYSGSPSHWHDAPYVTKAFKWAARQPGVEVWVQGFKPPWTFAQIVPWTTSLSEYRSKLGSFDVGVAPLRADKWANGKSDLKALEYGIAGVLPLVSAEEPYREFVEVFPELGVESDERAWVDAIKNVVKNRDAIAAKAAAVKQYVLENRTIDNPKNIEAWKVAVASV